MRSMLRRSPTAPTAALPRRRPRLTAVAPIPPDYEPPPWKPHPDAPTLWCVDCKDEFRLGDPAHECHRHAPRRPTQGGAVNSATLSGALQKVYPTGFKAFDRVAGKHATTGLHGIVEGQVIFLTGDPGAGKSTLLGRVCHAIAKRGGRAQYNSGEEAVPDIAARMAREGTRHERVLLLATQSWDEVEREIHRWHPHLVIVDSLSRMGTMHGGPTGSAEAMQAIVNRVCHLAKHYKWPKGVFRPCFVVIQHVNKKGQARGEVSLGHDVDTTMHLHRNDERKVSELYATKNRKGPPERSVLRFVNNRLEEVDTDAPPPQMKGLGEVGKVAAAVNHRHKVEPVMVEAVTRPATAEDGKKGPERVAIGFASRHLEAAVAMLADLTVEVMRRHILVRVSGVDGDVRDPAIELPVALAIYSALLQLRPPALGAFGGLTLRGDVDAAKQPEDRIAVLKGAGAPMVFGPQGIGDGVGLRPLATLEHAVNALLHSCVQTIAAPPAGGSPAPQATPDVPKGIPTTPGLSVAPWDDVAAATTPGPTSAAAAPETSRPYAIATPTPASPPPASAALPPAPPASEASPATPSAASDPPRA